MKILIQGHCSMQTQMTYCKAMFPDWDVRGILIPQANKWLDEKHPGFMTFLDEIDYFIGLTRHGQLATHLPDSIPRIEIPAFSFFGYHPDAVSMPQLGSPLELGAFHSRITATAFLEGLPEKDVAAQFNANRFEQLGYFGRFESDTTRVDQRYKSVGIEGIGEVIKSCASGGCFMHFPPHAHVEVFFDVFHRAMETAGLTAGFDQQVFDTARGGLDDYLERGLLWPVHPEIAENLGVEPSYSRWRLSETKSTGEWLDHDAFAARSYAMYNGYSDVQIEKMREFVYAKTL